RRGDSGTDAFGEPVSARDGEGALVQTRRATEPRQLGRREGAGLARSELTEAQRPHAHPNQSDHLEADRSTHQPDLPLAALAQDHSEPDAVGLTIDYLDLGGKRR